MRIVRDAQSSFRFDMVPCVDRINCSAVENLHKLLTRPLTIGRRPARRRIGQLIAGLWRGNRSRIYGALKMFSWAGHSAPTPAPPAAPITAPTAAPVPLPPAYPWGSQAAALIPAPTPPPTAA